MFSGCVQRVFSWEVLNGVGVDGVGVISPFFMHFSPFYAFFRFSSPFLRFSLLLLKDKGKQQQFTAKMGNCTPTPSAPTPYKTSRLRVFSGVFPHPLCGCPLWTVPIAGGGSGKGRFLWNAQRLSLSLSLSV